MQIDVGSEGRRIEKRRSSREVRRSKASQWLKLVAIPFSKCGGSWKGEVEIDNVTWTLKQMDGQRQVGRYLGS